MRQGILLLDKPLGLSSNAALQRVRNLFGRIKGGHTGSLDPLATGMLPICLGEATKVAGYLLEGDKEYLFTARFGARTATGDLEGEVVETALIPTDLRMALRAVLPRFMGLQSQIPPMYSALKRDGKPLYELARQGVEVERAARTVQLHQLELLRATSDEADFRVRCSKGTYVRTLAEDLARAVGSVAHVSALRRVTVAPFPADDLQTLAALEQDPTSARLLAPDVALQHLPAIQLDEPLMRRLLTGQTVPVEHASPGLVRAYGPRGRFLGITQRGAGMAGGAVLKPVRLFNDLGADST
jgi:tRNA pseudouridine55 synthase